MLLSKKAKEYLSQFTFLEKIITAQMLQDALESLAKTIDYSVTGDRFNINLPGSIHHVSIDLHLRLKVVCDVQPVNWQVSDITRTVRKKPVLKGHVLKSASMPRDEYDQIEAEICEALGFRPENIDSGEIFYKTKPKLQGEKPRAVLQSELETPK